MTFLEEDKIFIPIITIKHPNSFTIGKYIVNFHSLITGQLKHERRYWRVTGCEMFRIQVFLVDIEN